MEDKNIPMDDQIEENIPEVDENDIPEVESAPQPETADDPVEEANPQDEALRELERDLAKAKDSYLRLAAEYDNYRKRTVREKDEIYVDATAGSVLVLLPIIDNIERVASAENSSVEVMAEGLTMIATACAHCFDKLSVTSFGEVGEAFDSAIHNCISMTADAEGVESGCITLVLQKGYRMGDKIIRTAMVQVKS